MKIKEVHIKNLILTLISVLMCSYVLNSFISFKFLVPSITFLLVVLNVFYSLLYRVKIKLRREDLIVYFFLLITMQKSLYFRDFRESLLIIGMSFIPYFLVRFTKISERDLIFFSKCIFIIGVIVSIGYYINLDVLRSLNQTRSTVGGQHPVGVSGDFGIIITVSFYLFMNEKKWIIKGIYLSLGLFLLYLNFFILATRGGTFVSIICMTICYLLMGVKDIRSVIKKGFIILFCVGGLLGALNNDSFIARYPSLKRFSIDGMVNSPSVTGMQRGKLRYTGRKQNYQKALGIISQNPFLGEKVGGIYAHNIFLDFAASFGIFGLILWFGFLIDISKKCLTLIGIKKGFLIVILFIYSILIRQFSYNMASHKTLFILCGFLMSHYQQLKEGFDYNNLKIGYYDTKKK